MVLAEVVMVVRLIHSSRYLCRDLARLIWCDGALYRRIQDLDVLSRLLWLGIQRLQLRDEVELRTWEVGGLLVKVLHLRRVAVEVLFKLWVAEMVNVILFQKGLRLKLRCRDHKYRPSFLCIVWLRIYFLICAYLFCCWVWYDVWSRACAYSFFYTSG